MDFSDPDYLDHEKFYPLPFPGGLKGHVVGVLESPGIHVQPQMVGQEGVYQAAQSCIGSKRGYLVICLMLTPSQPPKSEIKTQMVYCFQVIKGF